MVIHHLRKQEQQKGERQEPWLEPNDSEEEEDEEGEESEALSADYDFLDDMAGISQPSLTDAEVQFDEDIEAFDPTFMSPGPYSVIKKGKAYVSILNAHYRYLDIILFMPAGTSLEQFLQAFEAPMKKFWFPYDYLSSYDRLSHPLPPYPGEAWHNSLRDCDLLDREHQVWQRTGKGDEPLTGLQKYSEIQRVWKKEGMHSLRCLLSFYNKLDVIPTILSMERMISEYFQQGVDVCMDACTIAGVARKVVFKFAQKKNTAFPQISAKNADLHYLIRNSICGGIALISTRYAEEGVTHLTPEKKAITSRIHSK